MIRKRRTFKQTGSQEIQLLLDSGPIKFSGGKWSALHPHLHIFDQTYVAENIHGGEQIDIDHRRNFYRVVVGPKGVALAAAIDAIDAEATATQAAITAEKKVLQQHVPKGMELDAFLKLPFYPDIDARIEAAALALKAVENTVEIAEKAKLSTVVLPALADDFQVLLAKGLPGVAADASNRIQSQILKHGFHDSGEAWLAEGLAHVADNECPFCGTSIASNALVAAYQGYFSEAYSAHKASLDNLLDRTEVALGKVAALKTVQAFRDNMQRSEFWSKYGKHGFTAPDGIDQAAQQIEALHDIAIELLKTKIAAPLDIIIPSATFQTALADWSATRASLANANDAMPAANVIIQAIKDTSAKANKGAAQVALAQLQAVKVRHTEPFLGLAKAYYHLVGKKDELTTAKAAKKDELDKYDAKLLGAYEADINKFLAIFNAGFRLVKCCKNYVGKAPQSAFCLQFDGHDLDVTAKPNLDDPTFGTTMSAGDKNTFALAFFLTQLVRDPDIEQKVVVFDDPFTSLDDFRREMTAKAIVRAGNPPDKLASQVIVFSHDKYFLNSIREKLHGVSCSTMQLSVTKGNAAISNWDIEWEVKEGYLQDHMRLVDFAAGATTDAAAMRTLMRPLLEKYIRYRFPNQIQEGFWLGNMLDIIRDDPTHPLKPQYDEICDVNEYTAPFHHDPNTVFNADEVLAHVKRTLAVVGGC